MSKPSKGRSLGVNLGLIITPMLDMSFQILAFFIMTYHPAALEAHIPGSLVPGERGERNPNKTIEPALDDPASTLEEPLLDAAVVQIKATTNNLGAPRQILVKLPLMVQAELVADVDVDLLIALRRLETRLKELRPKNEANVKIVADGELRQQYVMMVYDSCKNAGFQKIHFVPPPVIRPKD